VNLFAQPKPAAPAVNLFAQPKPAAPAVNLFARPEPATPAVNLFAQPKPAAHRGGKGRPGAGPKKGRRSFFSVLRAKNA